MPRYTEKDWQEAKKKCRLNNDDIAMAKRLGMTPKSLLKNIPNKNQQWKAPVKDWIEDLYFRKFGDELPVSKKKKSQNPEDDLPF